MAQTVDPVSLQPAGPPREVLDPVDYAAGSGYPAISFGSDLVAYWDGSAVATQLAWFDRKGNPLPQLPTPVNAHRVAISPDGRRVAFTQASGEATEGRSQVWVMDLDGTVTRWSFAPDNATAPIWSHDGSWLLFTGSTRGRDAIEIFRRALSGPAREESIGKFRVDGGSNNAGNYYATDTTEDMRTILASVTNPATGRDIVAVSAGSEQVTPVVNELGTDIQARFSPDGKQIAYASNLNNGPMEIYVEPFPRTGERWPISSGGGSQPAWRRDGKELFFLAPDGMMMASDMTPGAAPSGRPAKKLFSTRARQTYPPYPFVYDVTFDGQRFLIDSVVPGTGPTISVVVNWSPVPR